MDELIKRLNVFRLKEDEYQIIPVYVSEIIGEAADAIEELICEVADEHNARLDAEERQRWIPVAERLPNCNGCYLAWRPHFFCGEIGMPSICYFDGSNTWHDSYGVDFTRTLHPEDVTYWMPLPPAPKEE